MLRHEFAAVLSMGMRYGNADVCCHCYHYHDRQCGTSNDDRDADDLVDQH